MHGHHGHGHAHDHAHDHTHAPAAVLLDKRYTVAILLNLGFVALEAAAGFVANSTALLSDGTGTVGKAYGARTTPHMYIVDPAGRLVYAGGIDSIASSNPDDIPKAVNYVRQALGEALADVHPGRG